MINACWNDMLTRCRMG